VVGDETLGYTLIVMSQIDERSENSRLRSANWQRNRSIPFKRKREKGKHISSRLLRRGFGQKLGQPVN